MQGKWIVGAALVASFALACTAIAAAPPAPKEPLTMNLTPKNVTFSHEAHKARECGECHHQVNGEENYQKCGTAGCHDVLGAQAKGVNSYYRAFHDRNAKFNSCIRCHSEVVKTLPERKKDLTSCVGSLCHPK